MIDLKKKYGSEYKVIVEESYQEGDHKEAEKLWCYRIPGKYGHIGVWGKKTLSAHSDRPGAIRKLDQSGLKVAQRGDREITVLFTPSRITEVADIIRAKKRRKRNLTDEQRSELRERLITARTKRKTEQSS